MQRILAPVLITISVLGSVEARPAVAQTRVGQDAGCERINFPAEANFDFTETISRWGSRGSFDIDGSQYQIRNISLAQLPIFDESNRKEDLALYRWINRIHVDTQPEVIRNQLLFVSGDSVSSGTMAESERILRHQKYVSDSKLRVLQKCQNQLDVEVVTREVWTMTPDFSFHTSGGDTHSKIGIRDTNFLGAGQKISISYNNDPERNSYEMGFEDPDFRGRHRLLKLGVAESSDGYRYKLQYAQPFFALDSRHAWNLESESSREVLSQYQFGDKVTELRHDREFRELSWGLSGGLHDGSVQRLSGGLRLERHEYLPGIRRPSPAELPDDVNLLYPFLQFERIEDNFALAYNISQIYRTEDLHVGSHWLASAGYDPGDSGTLILAGEASDTLIYRPKQLLQWSADWYGRWDFDKASWEDSTVNLHLNYHRGQTEKRTLFMGLTASKGFNLNSAQQIFLGGSNGLRGYESHFLNGDGSVGFTVEERLFSNYHLWQILRLGFAAFYDAGRVFGSPDPDSDRFYQNVGLGLRLAPSKSDKGNIIHVDIAFPVGSSSRGSHSPQLVMELRESF